MAPTMLNKINSAARGIAPGLQSITACILRWWLPYHSRPKFPEHHTVSDFSRRRRGSRPRSAFVWLNDPRACAHLSAHLDLPLLFSSRRFRANEIVATVVPSPKIVRRLSVHSGRELGCRYEANTTATFTSTVSAHSHEKSAARGADIQRRSADSESYPCRNEEPLVERRASPR